MESSITSDIEEQQLQNESNAANLTVEQSNLSNIESLPNCSEKAKKKRKRKK